MAKQFENSVANLASGSENSFALPTAFGGSLALIFIAGVLTASDANWTTFAVLLFAFAAVGVSWIIVWRFKRSNAAINERKHIEWQSAMPEIQRQDLNIEVIQLSKVLDVSSDQIADLQSAYIVAQDLALRQIQQEEASLVLRHVTVGSVPFTAALLKKNYVVCIETSFVVSPELRQDRVEALLRKIAAVKTAMDVQNVKMDVRLMFVLITQLAPDDEAKLRRMVKERFANTPVTCDIRFLDFETLQRIYVTD